VVRLPNRCPICRSSNGKFVELKWTTTTTSGPEE
jgi:hypothetical protein